MTQRVIVCLLFALPVCGDPSLRAAKSAAAKIRIRQSAVSARSTILWAAQEIGLFAEHGVDMEVVYLRKRIMATLNPKVSRAKVEELIDNRFVRKLDDSGFIDALYVKNH